MPGRGQSGDSQSLIRRLRPVLISVAVGTAACVGVLLLFSLLLSLYSVPQSLISPLAIFALSASALVSGLCCSKMVRRNGLACGAACGLGLSVLVVIAGLILGDRAFGVPAMLKVTFVMLSAMIGGVLGVNTNSKRKAG